MTPVSFNLMVTTRSLYAVTVDWLSLAGTEFGRGGGSEGAPALRAATCAQDPAVALLPLKLTALGGAVLNPTEFLMMLTSCCMLCVHLAASLTC